MERFDRLPPSILGGDPFNQFRFLYRRELLWKLFDEEYCYSVMQAYYQAGGRGYDLSFEVNTRLFRRLLDETRDHLLGIANPTWEQGVFLNGRYLQYSRDRILRTLVEQLWPADIARQVKEHLSREAILVFGYDPLAALLNAQEIRSIVLDEAVFLKRLAGFEDCQIVLLGGADADYLVSLGREDVVAEMVRLARSQGFRPYLLSQYPSLVLPRVEAVNLDVEGYAVPLNKEWSWFDRESCLKAVQATSKKIIAFMPLASGDLKKDVRSALDWLYQVAGVESILFGTATAAHANETARIAQEARDAADAQRYHTDKDMPHDRR
jgi:hypothetical protein